MQASLRYSMPSKSAVGDTDTSNMCLFGEIAWQTLKAFPMGIIFPYPVLFPRGYRETGLEETGKLDEKDIVQRILDASLARLQTTVLFNVLNSSMVILARTCIHRVSSMQPSFSACMKRNVTWFTGRLNGPGILALIIINPHFQVE